MALACNECHGVIRHGEMHNCPKRLAALADLCERSTQGESILTNPTFPGALPEDGGSCQFHPAGGGADR